MPGNGALAKMKKSGMLRIVLEKELIHVSLFTRH